jgi:hypothetical protein
LLGGPWHWVPAGDGAPITAPADVPRWLTWGVFAAIVVATVWLRRIALRAWVLLLAYVAMVAGLLAATRLGGIFSPAAGLAPRYVTDVVLVAALCLGVALVGLREAEAGRAQALPAVLRSRTAVAAALVVALGAFMLGSAWSTARYADIWSVKHGRDFLGTARAELATAPPGTVFLDRELPVDIQDRLAWPYNLQSRFFEPVPDKPVFVTEGESPSVFDDAGHIRKAMVSGYHVPPGPDSQCGYRLESGRTVSLALEHEVYEWQWVVRIAYISSGPSAALLRLGDGSHWFQVHKGVGQIIFVIEGVGNTVELTVQDPSVTLCLYDVTVGQPVPAP